ncbi:MAG: DNA repair protein RadA [Paludibacteraceae bacterium]|nr:DNA repair protein RadA [Paludibacteraceae bacterium]MBN2786783.1 DNA repair protein RadA [Paludibacteraceae bacterium]
MAKTKTTYVCSNCGVEAAKWVGKCPSCGEWNSFVEELVRKDTSANKVFIPGLQTSPAKPQLIHEIETTQESRIDTSCGEFNRVLGGGLVPGSLVLIGGEPGIGKSTLVLQVVLNMLGKRTLYVSGEESPSQLKLRAERLKMQNDSCFILSETSLEQIFVQIQNVKPELVIVDSIQTMSTETADSSPGSITQIRECAASFLRYAKESNVAVIIIGHITKDGAIAGPKILEHIVDTVLQFEGDQHHMYRILRSIKNRFGSTSELGIFEMRQEGLREVVNPSELLLSEDHTGLSGVAISATIEGVRPFLIEVQALVSTAAYGTPMRSATGFDIRRMNMLLAVLEKRAGFKLAQKDVFLNIAGGLKVNDTAIDLAVMVAILSSNFDLAIEKQIAMAGEVGLSGEIRPINRIEQRLAEAEKLGFKKILVPFANLKSANLSSKKIEIIGVKKVEEAFRFLFKNNS